MTCLLLVVTAGAAATARQPDSTGQAGQSPIHAFHVTHDGKAIGRLIVNARTRAFTFNPRRHAPGTTLYLQHVVRDATHAVAAVVPRRSGTVHLRGRRPRSQDVPTRGAFIVAADSALVAVLTPGYWPDSCSDPSRVPYTCDVSADATRSTGATTHRLDVSMMKFGYYASNTICQGSDPYLGDPRVSATWGPTCSFHWELTIYDSFGNSASDVPSWVYPDPGWQ